MKAVSRHCSQSVHALKRHTPSQATESSMGSAVLQVFAIQTLCRAGLLDKESIAPLNVKCFWG